MNRRLPILIITLSSIFFSCTISFATPRDIRYHWSGEAANTLMYNQVMNGYGDGSFKPDNNITKEEFCVLLKSFGQKQGFITEEDVQNAQMLEAIEDVQNDWSATAIKYFLDRGVMLVNSDNMFEPEKYLTRAEMAQAIYNYRVSVEGYVPSMDTEEEVKDIEGIPEEDAIRALYNENLITGYKDATFRPDNSVTRGEIAVIFYRMSGLEPVTMEVSLPMYHLMEVPYISQLYPVNAPVGCEGASMLMGLKGKGYAADVDLKAFLDAMPKDPENPARGFVGSPYIADRSKKIRTTIFPEKLTEFGNQYGKVTNISGSSVQQVQDEVLKGNPVVIYATLDWEKPFYRQYDIDGQSVRLLSNNHVVLLTGYNAETNQYFICDPYNLADKQKEFKYWVDGATFEPIYNERKQALVVE